MKKIFAKHHLKNALTVFSLLLLTGCSSSRPDSLVRIAAGIDMNLQQPTATITSQQLQKIDAAYKSQHFTLIMQTEAQPGIITMAGLTPTGSRLFSVSFDGVRIDDWQSPLFTAPFRGSYLIADYQITHLDLVDLQHALPNDVTVQESAVSALGKKRTLTNAKGMQVITIHYRSDTPIETQGTQEKISARFIHYCHLEREYCLDIENLPQQ